jgi:hypothetical protein
VPRLEALVGTGVFYGAAGSETQAMQDRDVFVVGAGNSAVDPAVAGLAQAPYSRILRQGLYFGLDLDDQER